MITDDQRELLLYILRETDSLDKIVLRANDLTRTVEVVLEDLDDEDYQDLRSTMR